MTDGSVAVPTSTPPVAASLTRRASLNAVQALLDYTARLGVGLIVTPLLLRGLGGALFGVWQVLSQLTGYLSATDGRAINALRLVISQQQAIDDPAAKRRTVGAAVVVWVLFLPVVAIFGAGLVLVAPRLAKVDFAVVAVQLAAAILVINFVGSTLAGMPEAVLRGSNLGYRRMGVQAGLHVVGGILTVAALGTGLGLAGVAGAQIALTLVTGICFWLLVRRYVPWFGIARPRAAEVRALVGTSAWLAGGELIANLLLASDVVLLAAFTAPTVVTAYVLTGYAARVVRGLLFFGLNAVLPGLGGVIGERRFDRANGLRSEMLALTWLSVTAIGGTILLWNRSFLGLWVGTEQYAGMWPNLLIVLLTLQTALIRCDSSVIDACLKPRARVVVAAMAMVITLGAAVVLTPARGVVGLCLAMLAGRAVQSIAYPVLAASALGHPLNASVWLPTARAALATALVLGGAGWFGNQVVTQSWGLWIAAVLTTVVVLAALAFALGLGPAAQRTLRARVRAVVGGFRG